ncbi:MAG: VTT domain-containing protein [Xanthomonadaceae bacterium]|nr:VTT domain-containing protein [Xanthomonadaceae bacterium]
MNAVIENLSQFSDLQILLSSILLLLQGMVLGVFPEESIILALGAFWGKGKVEFWQAFLAIQLGLLPANLGLVFIGRTFGTRCLQVPPFKWLNGSGAVERALVKVKKNSRLTIALTRFTPFVRAPVYFAVGLSGFKLSSFLKIDALASLLQISILLAVGRHFT